MKELDYLLIQHISNKWKLLGEIVYPPIAIDCANDAVCNIYRNDTNLKVYLDRNGRGPSLTPKYSLKIYDAHLLNKLDKIACEFKFIVND